MGRWAFGLVVTVLIQGALAAGVVSGDGLVPHHLSVALTQGRRDVTLWLPDGFDIGVFADGLPNARVLAESPSGELVLSQHFEGKVVKLADHNGDGRADEVTPILTDLNVPHGLAFAGDVLFVAESDRVLRLDTWWDGSSAHPIISLPNLGHHQTRTLAIGPDGKLYVSTGASCDVCVETDPRRASVWRYDLDGSNGEVFATGLRNAVGLAFQPGTDTLWVTDNERNELGDEIPPDELDVLEAGADYGWPACFGDRVSDPAFGTPERCAGTRPPILQFPAHSAPLGLTFYEGGLFPSAYRSGIFVALHGSALRSQAVGYELLTVPMRDGQPGSPTTFARGWLVGDDSWGRPVFPFVAHDGTLYLTDDKGGVVYWIRPSDRA